MKNPVVWFEVVGKDGAKLRRFYTDLFGWKIEGASGDTVTDPQGHIIGLSKGVIQ